MSRQLTGRVTSDKPDKTIVISVASRKTHPIYKKQYTRNTKFMAHDERNEAKKGDLVIIRETRPLSARKRFTLDSIVEKAHIAFVEDDATADVPREEPKLKSQKPKDAASKSPASNPQLSGKEAEGSDK
ncbi:30S ribosomal protein S17 [Candidatus Saccharibacteria bacterium]|nr:30S ribosomal protein S17 [Candidatus Saccharibacteria bacterium]